MTEEALVDREPGGGRFDLTLPGPAPQMPRDLADLRQRLRRDRLPEAGETATRVDGHPLAAEGRVAVPDEPLGLYEEVVSLAEALHEDIYFNTLDYLAALGVTVSYWPSFCR